MNLIQGAKFEYGGERVYPADPTLKEGFYLSPCILTDCHDSMRIATEEVFGAVMCVMPFDEEEEVIERANNTNFGLAAGVFTRLYLSAIFRCLINVFWCEFLTSFSTIKVVYFKYPLLEVMTLQSLTSKYVIIFAKL